MDTKEDLTKKTREIDIDTKRGKDFIGKYSDVSKKVIKTQLRKFLVFTDENCDQLIESISEERKGEKIEREYKTEAQVNEFINFLENLGYSSHSVSSTLATVRAFYKFHDFPLHDARLKKVRGKTKRENKVAHLDQQKMAQLYNATSSKRNKALLLFLYQTGQGREQISELNYGDIADQLKEGKSPLMINYSGRKGHSINYCAFLGADGIHALEQYIDERVKKLNEKDGGKEVLTKKGELRYKAPLFAKRDGVRRLTPGAISEILKYIAENTEVVSEEKMEYADINPLRPHAFRHNFKTTLTPFVSSFIVEYLMGHSLGTEGEYFINEVGDKEDLRKYYAENIEEHLSIQTTTTEKEAYVSEDFEDLKKEKIRELAGSEELAKKLENWKEKWSNERMERKALEEKIDKLENEKEKTNDLLAEYKRKIDNLEDSMREMRRREKKLFEAVDLDELKEELTSEET